jgi:hypothetical protein
MNFDLTNIEDLMKIERKMTKIQAPKITESKNFYDNRDTVQWCDRYHCFQLLQSTRPCAKIIMSMVPFILRTILTVGNIIPIRQIRKLRLQKLNSFLHGCFFSGWDLFLNLSYKQLLFYGFKVKNIYNFKSNL